MAAIAEETEQERLAREEQEAALAEMQQLLDSRIAPPDSPLPQEAIPADNVSFTNGADGQIQIDTPEGFAPQFDRQMIGDAQYQNELARAQRGNGFLNADIGPSGNTIVPGYDPAIAEAAQRRQQAKLAAQAERFMGVQGYQQSIQSGATPAEALALWGQKMYSGDPEALASVVTRREPLAKVAPLQKFVAGKVPPAVRASENNLVNEIRSLRQQLSRPGLGGLPIDPAEADALKAQIAAKEQQRVQLLDQPQYNPNVDQVGFQAMRPAWEAAGRTTRPQVSTKAAEQETPFKEGATVRNKRDGKLYRVVKGVPVEVKE